MSGHFEGPCTTLAVIAFGMGCEVASHVVETARYGNTIYAAIRRANGSGVQGFVVLMKRRGGLLFVKIISEDMGPSHDKCPARVLDQLTEPAANENARDWRRRCRRHPQRSLVRVAVERPQGLSK